MINRRPTVTRLWAGLLLAALAATALPAAAVDVTIANQDGPVTGVEVQIINQDGPGEGLNDPTPCGFDCDNRGDTLGEQRRIALQYAADFVGDRLVSIVPIRIAVDFRSDIKCKPRSAVLASAGAIALVSDFTGAPRRDTLYPTALANALAGTRLLPGQNDISARFNSLLDSSATCLGGRDWYYGLDAGAPDGEINFVSTAIHEFVHGLGFQSFVILNSNGTGGQFPYTGSEHLPDVFSRHIRDLSIVGQPLWTELTAAERAQSATHGPYLVWDGISTNSAASALSQGTSQARVQLYAPCRVAPGSSVSHWSTRVRPEQLMEPNLTSLPILNLGLAACALQDMGWTLSPVVTGCSASGGSVGSPDYSSSESYSCGPSNGSGGSDSGSSSGGGGGCTVNPNAAFDPMLLLLVVLACGTLLWRRRSGRAT